MSSAEQDLIQACFAPLAGKGAASLLDDAAVWLPATGMDTVVSTDTLVEGVHFIGDEPPELIARKSLRVNISDLVAKGAIVRAYLLNLIVTPQIDAAWLSGFAKGLAQDQSEFNCELLGGDTVSSDGPLTITITAFGEVPCGKIVRRGSARPGDVVYVTGTIGDGALGLDVLQGNCRSLDDTYLIDRYRLPRPRTDCVELIREFSSAAMDISDGLVGDLEQLAKASGCGASIVAGLVPFSSPVESLSLLDNQIQKRALTGGDDYEILFTVSDKRADTFEAACKANVRHIGEMNDTGKVVFRTAGGERMSFVETSWSHVR